MQHVDLNLEKIMEEIKGGGNKIKIEANAISLFGEVKIAGMFELSFYLNLNY